MKLVVIMGIDEIESDYDGAIDLTTEVVYQEPLNLDRNSEIEKVDRFVRHKLRAIQDWFVEGVRAIFTTSVWEYRGNPIGYVADKVGRLVRGLMGGLVFIPLLCRGVWGVSSAGLNLVQKLFFHTNDFFYYRGQRRDFKEQLETFVHWNVDLYSHSTILSGELPFAERRDAVIKALKEKAPDMLFLSHVDGNSADYLFEGLKSEYIDFFLDVGSKGGWSIDGGLFIASKVPLASPPRFYQLDLRQRFSYQGGFFVIETADRLFIVTDMIHGSGSEEQDLRAAAITEIIHFLQLEHAQSPLKKEIFITGDLPFSSQLEVQVLHDELFKQEQVSVEVQDDMLRVYLEVEPSKISEIAQEAHTYVYASNNTLEAFTLIPIEPAIEESEVIPVEETPTEERRFEEHSADTDHIYTYKERDHIATGGGLEENMPYQEVSFEGLGELKSEGIIRDTLFAGRGGKSEDEKRIEEQWHVGRGERPEPALVEVETEFTATGATQEHEPSVISTSFTAKGERLEEVLEIVERQFEGRGAEEAAIMGVVDTPYEAIGKREEAFEVEDIAFASQGQKQEEDKELKERQFEGYGDEIKIKDDQTHTDDIEEEIIPTDDIIDEVVVKDDKHTAEDTHEVIIEEIVDDTSVSKPDEVEVVVDETSDVTEPVEEPKEEAIEEEKPAFVDRIFR